MKHLLLVILIAVFLITPSTAFSSSEHPQFLPDKFARLREANHKKSKEAILEWVSLFTRGNKWEKQVALDGLLISKFYTDLQKNSSVLVTILNALKDDDPAIRSMVADFFKKVGEYSKGRAKDSDIVPSLAAALEDENADVRREIACGLAYYRDKRAVDPLIRRLQDENPWVKLEAAFALGNLRDHNAVSPLLDLLSDDSDFGNKFAQQECLKALRQINHRSEKLIQILIDAFDDAYLKSEIIITLGHFKAQEAESILKKAIKDPDDEIRLLALKSLERLVHIETIDKEDSTCRPNPLNPKRLTCVGGYTTEVIKTDYPGRHEVLLYLLKDPSSTIRAYSAAAIADIKGIDTVNALISVLNDSHRAVVIKAIRSLRKMPHEKAVVPVIEKLNHRNLDVQKAATVALKAFNRAKLITDDQLIDMLIPKARNSYFRKIIAATASKTALKKVTIKKDRISFKLIVHPQLAEKLVSQLEKADAGHKLPIIYLMGEFKDEKIDIALVNQLGDTQAQIRKAACKSINRTGAKNGIEPLIACLKDEDPGVRRCAAETLGRWPDPRALDPLIACLDDQDSKVRRNAFVSIGEYDDPKCFEINAKALAGKDKELRKKAASYFMKNPDKKAVPYLLPLLHEDHDWLLSVTIDALGKTKDSKAVDAVIDALAGKYRSFKGNMGLRKKAASILGSTGEMRAVQPLIDTLNNTDEAMQVRIAAARSLGELGDVIAVPSLEKALKIDHRNMQHTAKKALKKLRQL